MSEATAHTKDATASLAACSTGLQEDALFKNAISAAASFLVSYSRARRKLEPVFK
jgi:hypothetical protein